MLDSNTTYWTESFDSEISAPIVVNGTCYIGTQNGYLSKLSLENGSFIANLSLGGIPTTPISANPSNGKIVLGLSTGEILIISENFQISRRIPLTSFGTQAQLSSGALFIGNEFIIASSYDNGTAQWTIVHKFDENGNELQNSTLSGMCTSTPAFDGNSIYIGIGSKLYHLSQSLSSAWANDLGSDVSSSPVIYGGRIGITAGAKGFLYSTSGLELWSINAGGMLYASPLFRAGYAYFACSNGRLYIVNITTGANTSIPMAGEIVASPVQADGKMYLACSNILGSLQCINATSNEEIWQTEIGSPIVNSLAISGGVLLVPAGNVLHAFGGVKRGVSLVTPVYTKYFSPGSEDNFTVYVKNEGNVADNIELYLSEVPEEWYASLSSTQLYLQPNEIRPIMLNMRAPYIRVDSTAMPLVTATIPGCMSNGIRLGAVLIVNYDFSFECIDAIKDVKVNSTVTYTINITNLGNIDEDYEISVESYPQGWNPHLSLENVHLEIAESKMLYLNVTSPRNGLANETARIIVKANSTSKPELSKRIVTTTIVEPMYFMDIECALPNKAVQPGGNVTFWLHITNRGNDMDSAILNITSLISEYPEGWKVNFSQPTQIIAPHEFFDIPVKISAPENATAGRSAVFTINSTSCGNNSAYDFISLTSIVMQKFEIDAKSLTSNYLSLLPGEKVDFPIVIENIGNGPDIISMKVDSILPYHSFRPSYYYNGLPVEEIIAQPFSSVIVNFSFIIPIGTPADNYTFVCNITNQVGKSITLNFEVNVLKVHLVTVRVLQSTYYSTPGKSVKILFDIINKGNCKDDILISIVGLDSSWIIWQDTIPKNYTLDIGEVKSSLFFYIA
ncbi:MAG: PQQ-binding-like beta-propeller repeat protein, partial [Thermoplasmata archaeon]